MGRLPLKYCAMPEETLWTGSSSQVKNLKPFAVCALAMIAIFATGGWLMSKDWGKPYGGWLLLLALVPIGIAIWKWLQVRARKYQLTTERLLITTGIVNVVTNSLELYRVRDIRMSQPVFLRVFNLENVDLTTSDLSSPVVSVDHVPKAEMIGNKIRTQVEACRLTKGTREIEMQ